jgi:hypothetical protein
LQLIWSTTQDSASKLNGIRLWFGVLVTWLSYKYLRSTVNTDNSIEEEILCRITLGNEAYCANQFLFKSGLVSKKSKLKLYWSIIRPIVTYACEVWVLRETIKNKLMVFESKVLRKIFGLTKERDCAWRIKTNDELDELLRHKKIINHIKAQLLTWFGHLRRLPEW